MFRLCLTLSRNIHGGQTLASFNHARRSFGGAIDPRPKSLESVLSLWMYAGLVSGSWRGDQADIFALSAEDHVAMVPSSVNIIVQQEFCTSLPLFSRLFITSRLWNAPTRWYWRLSAWVKSLEEWQRWTRMVSLPQKLHLHSSSKSFRLGQSSFLPF